MKTILGIICILLIMTVVAEQTSQPSKIRITCEHHSIMAFQEGEAESHFYHDDGKISLLEFSTNLELTTFTFDKHESVTGKLVTSDETLTFNSKPVKNEKQVSTQIEVKINRFTGKGFTQKKTYYPDEESPYIDRLIMQNCQKATHKF